jgi:hypothetical protein
MDEVREKLRPHVGKRIKIRGVLSAYDSWEHRRRDIRRACIYQPEMDCEVVGDHVWVLGTGHWPEDNSNIGRQVEFDAVVQRYGDPKLNATNFCLANPGELKLLTGPPCLRPPEPDMDEKIIELAEEPVPEPAKPPDPLATLRQVRLFTRAVGGQEAALKVVQALEAVTIPVPDLVAWVKAMGEE